VFEQQALRLLREILEELRAQRALLEKPRLTPQPESSVIIRCGAVFLDEYRHCWMNTVSAPDSRLTRNAGVAKKGLCQAELLSLYSALQQVFQYPAAHRHLKIRFCSHWLAETLESNLEIPSRFDEGLSNLIYDTVYALQRFKKVDTKAVTIDEDHGLLSLAREITQMKTEILESEKCSQQVESESSQKKTKSSSTKVPTESS